MRGPDTARALLPPGRGRGSSVSSIVCYLTGLSHIDPVENELFLGRFLNEELTALPDIDLDFPRDIRESLIPRVHERYGRDHSALVAAFPTYKSRGAIREIGKALGLPPGEIERVARVAEPWAQTVDEDIELALGAAAEAAGDDGQRARRGGRRRAGRPRRLRLRPAAVDAASAADAAMATMGRGARPPRRAGSGAHARGLRRQLRHGAGRPHRADARGGGGGGLRRRRSRPRPPPHGAAASTTPTGTRARGGAARALVDRPRRPPGAGDDGRPRGTPAGSRRSTPATRAGSRPAARRRPRPPGSCRAAGAGWRRWRRRPTGCRATSPSTPAG